MSKENIREEFEFRFPLPDGMRWCATYQQYTGHKDFWLWTDRFNTWQASREALVIELPDEDSAGWGPGDCGDGRPSEEQYIASHCNMVLKKCRKSIESAGVKVCINGRESLNLADAAISKENSCV